MFFDRRNDRRMIAGHGAQVAVRRLVPPLRVREAIEGATVETGERLFGAVVLFGITADQVHGLEAPLTLV